MRVCLLGVSPNEGSVYFLLHKILWHKFTNSQKCESFIFSQREETKSAQRLFVLDILHIVMFRLECHLGNAIERLLFQTNIVEKNPYILTIGGSAGSTMPESYKLQEL